jgi:hypothetical protein
MVVANVDNNTGQSWFTKILKTVTVKVIPDEITENRRGCTTGVGSEAGTKSQQKGSECTIEDHVFFHNLFSLLGWSLALIISNKQPSQDIPTDAGLNGIILTKQYSHQVYICH